MSTALMPNVIFLDLNSPMQWANTSNAKYSKTTTGEIAFGMCVHGHKITRAQSVRTRAVNRYGHVNQSAALYKCGRSPLLMDAFANEMYLVKTRAQHFFIFSNQIKIF